jgi:flagellar biosynthesis/type III secretory pathway M-ring protein FliF/YscJ|tara:strand:- start:292 stop:609 length:318 start_codon:yes stop_codon:yes gene_type:complete
VQNFIDIYLQAGAAGLVCVLFAFMIMNLIRSQREQTEDLDRIKNDITKLTTEMSNSQSIVIKLVDRLNVSDNSREKFHIDIIKEINDLSDVMMEVKGSVSRINGK